MLHQKDHPNYVEGCFGCKVISVSVAASAMPTRKEGQAAQDTNTREKQWSKDHAAYRRLRKEGLRPRSTVGAAKVEKLANHSFEIESGRMLGQNKSVYRRIEEGMAISKEQGFIK